LAQPGILTRARLHGKIKPEDARPKCGRPLQNLRAPDGFVEDSPSGALRDGERTPAVKMNDYRRRKKIAANEGAVYI